MNILVINCGSSSIKYQIFDMHSELAIVSGMIENINTNNARHIHRRHLANERTTNEVHEIDAGTHREALEHIEKALQANPKDLGGQHLYAVGHRVVHGGEKFRQPALIDARVLEAIKDVSTLAPLHNPANIIGIEVSLDRLPNIPQVAVFDTSFHQTMPARAYRYALPGDWYTQHNVRRYGFHGTSHSYVAKQLARHLKQPLSSLNLITLHLGNGASATAIKNGESIDTSMGLTPLEGLIMGTRCGDIDPAILAYMSTQTHAELNELDNILNKHSGLKGLTGVNDMREIEKLANTGNDDATLAINMYCYRIKKYIGAYIAILGKVNAIIFTAGIGENAPWLRERICTGLTHLGIHMDNEANRSANGDIYGLHAKESAIALYAIKTNEELEIAQQTLACARGTSPSYTRSV